MRAVLPVSQLGRSPRLPRHLRCAAQFTGALQHRADPGRRRRASRSGRACARFSALGVGAILGQGQLDGGAHDQCAGRNRGGETIFSGRLPQTPLFGAGGWILRMARSENRNKIYTMYVVAVDRRLALDVELPNETAVGEQCLAEAEQLARDVNLSCTGSLFQARDVGHAVVDEAVTRGVDVVVVGIAARAFEGPVLDIGRTAEYVLRYAPCEVIIVRDEVSL